MTTLTRQGKEWYLHAVLLKLNDFYDVFEKDMTQEQRQVIVSSKEVITQLQNAIYA